MGGSTVCVPAKGGIVEMLGSVCEEVYPFIAGEAVAMWAVGLCRPGPCVWGGVMGPACCDCVAMAGIWGRERAGYVATLGEVVCLG